jgi:DNA recombination protein RmuC
MVSAALLISGIVIGAVVCWVLTGSRLAALRAQNTELQKQLSEKSTEYEKISSRLTDESGKRVEAHTRLEETLKTLENEKNRLEEMKSAFSALSGQVLESNKESFLTLAQERLGKLLADAKSGIGDHRTAMEGLVQPLKDQLKSYEEHLKNFDLKREALDQHITTLNASNLNLRQETENLVTALRKPYVRGRWAEVQLRRVVELAGMNRHCDFEEQKPIGPEDRSRPDMKIMLPGGKVIAVDSKCPEAFLDVSAAKDEEERKTALRRHGQLVKDHIDSLSKKAYWERLDKGTELVIMFIGESALVAAFEENGNLLEESLKKRVLLATPTTLIALLTAVAFEWRQQEIAKNAEIIGRMGKELYERFRVFYEHFGDLGKNITGAVNSFNKAVGSADARIVPQIKKFRELGVQGEDLKNVNTIGVVPKIARFEEY